MTGVRVGDARSVSSLLPNRQDDAVARKSLVERLERRLGKRFILIKAAAGFGKTTLLREFWDTLEGRDIRRVWVSLTAGDSDPIGFVSALISAYVVAAGEADCSNLTLPDMVTGSADAALARLIRTLENHKRVDVVFIIDEYQNAQGAETDRLLQVFLQQAPMHVTTIVAARKEPACGGAKMRLNGDLEEFTQEDLAFELPDIHKMFSDVNLARPDIEILFEKTRGWPAALRLAKLWRSHSDFAADGFARFSGELPDVANYLAQEVFMGLPDDMKDFLCKTSILPYIDAETADAVLGRGDSAKMLRRLNNLKAFISPTDPVQQRYRHHPLFADFLRWQLYKTYSSTDIADLHDKAAKYFDEKRDYLLALSHAVETEDETTVERILNEPGFGLLWLAVDYNEFVHVMRRIRQINSEISERLRPINAFYLMKAGRFDDAGKELKKTKEILDSNTNKNVEDPARGYLEADFLLMYAIFYIFTDKREDIGTMISSLESKIQGNDIAHPMYLGVLNNALGILLFRLGRIDQAKNSFAGAVEKFREAGSEFSIVHNALHLAMVAMLRADMVQVSQIIDDVNLRRNKYLSGDSNLSATINVMSAEHAFEKGDLDAAYLVLPSARAALTTNGDYWVELLASAFRIEARLAYIHHGLDAAMGLSGQGLDIAKSREFERLETCLIAHRIHLAAIAGDTGFAGQIAKDAGCKLSTLRIDPTEFGWHDDVTLAFALIRLEINRNNTGAALRALDNIDKAYEASGLARLTLKSKALRALALFVDGQTQEATTMLRALIEEADTLGVMSFFLEEGLIAQEFLDETARRFQRSKRADDFNDILLKWLIASSSYLPLQERARAPQLSPQQQRILSLLARGYDRQEIAREAETTIHNVQYHLKKMFELFDVTSSARLVAESVRLNLVDNRAAKLSTA
ncbi:MAG: AAA family ATPase [Pseudomonadota bacterium]